MKLRSYLTQEGLSPEQFAALLGVRTQSIYRYINGERLPRRDVMERIADQTRGSVQANDFFARCESRRSVAADNPDIAI